MAAVVYPMPREWVGCRESPKSPAPSGLRPLDGNEEVHSRVRSSSRLSRAVILRRQLVAVLVAAGVLAILRPLVLPGGDPLVAPGQSTPAATEVTSRVYIVQQGDTLWSIARRLHPGADPRPLVDQLATQVKGGVLQPGDRLVLP